MKEYKTMLPEITLTYKTGEQKKVKITSADDSNKLFRELYDFDTIELNEKSIVLFLNQANNTIGWLLLATGGISGCVIDPRLVLATALKCNATGIIISHNHPSGKVDPSEDDKKLTSKIKDACDIMMIRFIDHIIITVDSFYSFANEGTL